MLTREVKRDLPVEMNQAEKDSAAREFVGEYERHQALLSEKDQVYAAWRRRIKDSSGRVSHASEMAKKGLRLEPVACRETYDLSEGVARIVRLDTGEELSPRPLTDDEIEALEAERQIELEGVDGE